MNERQKAAKAKPKSLGRRVADGDISISEAGDIALGITSKQPRDGETLSGEQVRIFRETFSQPESEVERLVLRLCDTVAALKAENERLKAARQVTP